MTPDTKSLPPQSSRQGRGSFGSGTSAGSSGKRNGRRSSHGCHMNGNGVPRRSVDGGFVQRFVRTQSNKRASSSTTTTTSETTNATTKTARFATTTTSSTSRPRAECQGEAEALSAGAVAPSATPPSPRPTIAPRRSPRFKAPVSYGSKASVSHRENHRRRSRSSSREPRSRSRSLKLPPSQSSSEISAADQNNLKATLNNENNTNNDSHWACAKCTFENPWNKRRCHMCHERRSVSNGTERTKSNNPTTIAPATSKNVTVPVESSSSSSSRMSVRPISRRQSCSKRSHPTSPADPTTTTDTTAIQPPPQKKPKTIISQGTSTQSKSSFKPPNPQSSGPISAMPKETILKQSERATPKLSTIQRKNEASDQQQNLSNDKVVNLPTPNASHPSSTTIDLNDNDSSTTLPPPLLGPSNSIVTDAPESLPTPFSSSIPLPSTDWNRWFNEHDQALAEQQDLLERLCQQTMEVRRRGETLRQQSRAMWEAMMLTAVHRQPEQPAQPQEESVAAAPPLSPVVIGDRLDQPRTAEPRKENSSPAGACTKRTTLSKGNERTEVPQSIVTTMGQSNTTESKLDTVVEQPKISIVKQTLCLQSFPPASLNKTARPSKAVAANKAFRSHMRSSPSPDSIVKAKTPDSNRTAVTAATSPSTQGRPSIDDSSMVESPTVPSKSPIGQHLTESQACRFVDQKIRALADTPETTTATIQSDPSKECGVVEPRVDRHHSRTTTDKRNSDIPSNATRYEDSLSLSQQSSQTVDCDPVKTVPRQQLLRVRAKQSSSALLALSSREPMLRSEKKGPSSKSTSLNSLVPKKPLELEVEPLSRKDRTRIPSTGPEQRNTESKRSSWCQPLGEQSSTSNASNVFADSTNSDDRGTSRNENGSTNQTPWISNRHNRGFLQEMDQRTKPPEHPRQGKQSCHGVWSSSRRSTSPKPSSVSTKKTTDLWDSQPGESQCDDDGGGGNNPAFAYQETVRCKKAREGLSCFDCYKCRRFYEVLRATGHEVDEPDQAFQRHRAAHVPNETPNDFWNLDFADESGDRI